MGAGRGHPDLDKIIKLSELYGISLDALLKEEPQPAKTQQTPPHPHKADWNRILTWGGLLGGSAMVVWGLTDAVGLMAYEQIASNMLSGAVNVMGVTMTGEAQSMFSQFLPTSQILWAAPVAKLLLIGAALIGLGLWGAEERKDTSMKHIKPGRGPSAMGGIGAAAAAVFGIFWTAIAPGFMRPSA